MRRPLRAEGPVVCGRYGARQGACGASSSSGPHPVHRTAPRTNRAATAALPHTFGDAVVQGSAGSGIRVRPRCPPEEGAVQGRSGERSAQRLAVDGHHPIAQSGRPTLGKPRHRPLQAPGVRRVERVGEGVAARNAVRKPHEAARKPFLGTAEALHVGATPAAARRRQETDHRHPVRIAERRIAPTRVRNILKYMNKLFHVGSPHTYRSTQHESINDPNTPMISSVIALVEGSVGVCRGGFEVYS